MEYLMILIQIKVICYQKMKAKTIFGLRQASYTPLWQSGASPTEKGWKVLDNMWSTNAAKRPNVSHQPLVNNNGNGAERGFEWEHYNFEDPLNPESDHF